ncbi:MAG: hypothetical protein MMC23_003461 [Stictis urceolatum]|nr:hypothetical protein [Stictis urceolata]
MNHLLTFKPSPLPHDQFYYLLAEVGSDPRLISQPLTNTFNSNYHRRYSRLRLQSFYQQSYDLNKRKVAWLSSKQEAARELPVLSPPAIVRVRAAATAYSGTSRFAEILEDNLEKLPEKKERQFQRELARVLRNAAPLTKEELEWTIMAMDGAEESSAVDKGVLNEFHRKFRLSRKYGLRHFRFCFGLSRRLMVCADLLETGKQRGWKNWVLEVFVR